MQEVGVFLLIVFIAVFVFLLNKARLKDQQRILQEIAHQRLGKYNHYLYPQVQVFHQNQKIYLYCAPADRGAPVTTNIVCSLKLPKRFWLLIYNESAFERFTKRLGAQDIQVNNPAFDEKYMIKSSDPQVTRLILSRDVQEKMLRLFSSHVSIRITKRRLSIKLSRLIENRREGEELLDLAVLLINKLQFVG